MSRALLQQALKNALEAIRYESYNDAMSSISEALEELAKPENDAIGQILDDATFYGVGFDQRTGRVIWFKSTNEFHNGASIYTHPPQPKPLTPSEFWEAAPWQPMETALKDGSFFLAKDEYNYINRCYWAIGEGVCGGVWCGSMQFKNPIAWLPLPEQK